MSSVLGWLATAATAGSFLSRQAATLQKVQAAAACLWIIYGANIDAAPLIVANLIVAAMAFYSSLAERSTWKRTVVGPVKPAGRESQDGSCQREQPLQ
jgi:heme O synthase-like polyprenyltransferase